MITQISKLDVYIGLALNGVFTGLGAAIGTYFAQNHIITRAKRIVNKIIGKK